jgi:hypothetical protein
MNAGRIAAIFAIAGAVGIATANVVLAAEARPWLCRDKPVFSYDRPMEYEASSRAGHRWRVFFMQFTPGAAHDGFEVIREAALPSRGSLDPGRYYAVALYSQGNYWICPGYAGEDGALKAGQVANFCYAKDEPPCGASLIVRPADRDTNPSKPGSR